jgi:hypothetical protein
VSDQEKAQCQFMLTWESSRRPEKTPCRIVFPFQRSSATWTSDGGKPEAENPAQFLLAVFYAPALFSPSTPRYQRLVPYRRTSVTPV